VSSMTLYKVSCVSGEGVVLNRDLICEVLCMSRVTVIMGMCICGVGQRQWAAHVVLAAGDVRQRGA